MKGFRVIRVMSQIWFINTKLRNEVSLSLFRGFLNYKEEIEYAQTNGSEALREVDKCMSTCVFMASKLVYKSRNKR